MNLLMFCFETLLFFCGLMLLMVVVNRVVYMNVIVSTFIHLKRKDKVTTRILLMAPLITKEVQEPKSNR
ncbi:hypothetical protein Scep_000507 [Stephania cephalantha]|uniref:Uncharacterized protein n=1 Tax=Stephania cephalantha TaxID=152367 RepID=A0AAP0L6T7_9MAGN